MGLLGSMGMKIPRTGSNLNEGAGARDQSVDITTPRRLLSTAMGDVLSSRNGKRTRASSPRGFHKSDSAMGLVRKQTIPSALLQHHGIDPRARAAPDPTTIERVSGTVRHPIGGLL